MLRQSPSRNQRAANGFKVKHVLQVFLLLAICAWVLYQVSHKDVAGADRGSDGERMKFGRKELRPRPENLGREEEDEPGEDFQETGVEGRGVGVDDIDRNDLEIAEEADAANEFEEDFGDKEDKETEDGDESSTTETGRSEGEEKKDQRDGILQGRHVGSDASS